MSSLLSESQLAELKNSLKRCSPETLTAVIRYRQEGDVAQLPIVVLGVIERYLPPESAGRQLLSDPNSRLAEDLGIDSLTMLEIVLLIEEALAVHIDDTELRNIKTLGDINQFLKAKIEGPSTSVLLSKSYQLNDLIALLPHQPPFLFLDSAEITPEGATARYAIRGDEFALQGHFKNDPVFPASLAFEALGQAACLWILEQLSATHPVLAEKRKIYFASMEGAHFYRRCVPGDLLELSVTLDRVRDPLAIFSGQITVNGEKACQVERLILAYAEPTAVAAPAEESVSSPQPGVLAPQSA